MSSDPWIMMRLRRFTTHARLEKLRQRLLAAYESGHLRDPAICDGLSLDALITRLLDGYDRHTARWQKHRAVRKRRCIRAPAE